MIPVVHRRPGPSWISFKRAMDHLCWPRNDEWITQEQQATQLALAIELGHLCARVWVPFATEQAWGAAEIALKDGHTTRVFLLVGRNLTSRAAWAPLKEHIRKIVRAARAERLLEQVQLPEEMPRDTA